MSAKRMTQSELEQKIAVLQNTLTAYYKGEVMVDEPGLLRAELRTYRGKLNLGLFRIDSSVLGGCGRQSAGH